MLHMCVIVIIPVISIIVTVIAVTVVIVNVVVVVITMFIITVICTAFHAACRLLSLVDEPDREAEARTRRRTARRTSSSAAWERHRSRVLQINNVMTYYIISYDIIDHSVLQHVP